VIKKFEDEEFRNWIIENAYKDLIESGKYTYRKFSNKIVDHLIKLNQSKNQTFNLRKYSHFYSAKILMTFRYRFYQLKMFYKKVKKLITIKLLYFRRFVNYSFFRLVVLPGSRTKQALIRRKFWPLRID
jgi:hypothetical protein